MRFTIPKNIKDVLFKLKNNDIDAYLVGGCVRDMLMGKTPHDYDITSSADPEKIKEIFDKTIDTGIKHGTVTVLSDGEPVEITQMRTDGEYIDHRHPVGVLPAKKIEEDLLRRDFTVNAMALDHSGKIIDISNGLTDLENGVIRAVGDPYRRFDEDALRIMRAYRFCSQLEFKIEAQTEKAALKMSNLLYNISAERINQELCKLLVGQNPKIIAPLINSGGLKQYGLSSIKDSDRLNKAENRLDIRLSSLIILCGADPKSVCTSLKTDNKTKKRVIWYCERLNNVHTLANASDIAIKSMINTADREMFEHLLSAAQVLFDNDISGCKTLYHEIMNDPIFLNEMKINGKKLCEIGIHGEAVGRVMKALQQEVWKNPKINDEQTLCDIAKRLER